MEQLFTLDKSCIFCGERESKKTPLTSITYMLKTIKTIKTSEGIKTIKELNSFDVWLCKDHTQTPVKEIQNILGNPINLNNL